MFRLHTSQSYTGDLSPVDSSTPFTLSFMAFLNPSSTCSYLFLDNRFRDIAYPQTDWPGLGQAYDLRSQSLSGLRVQCSSQERPNDEDEEERR